ncbi:MAG: hypothetical protein LQ343_000877 [Gyalolechia ehrenbergii]|nr:MAG: hypothetical protein LQ343_000877 [Gyalolechia ehrenbergii]
MSPIKKSSLKKEYPLVLLHVTLLPIPRVYSTELMEQVLPNYILENWKILREKATDTVIERGILIPHPKEDYDLMEERLLESLDLKTPRILKCGHFHLDPDEERDVAVPDEEDLDDEDNDADICADCGRRVRDGRYGSGAGSRRWDIKVYAANGLMKAGAWSAAWREMERVDVEITPWMADEFKRELVLRAEEERKHDALVQEEVLAREVQRPTIDEERMREIYGDDLPVFDKENEDPTMSAQSTRSVHGQPNEIPLRDLLKEYLVAAAQDRKNIAILLLSIFVLHLSIASMRSPKPSIASHQPFLSSPDWSILTSSTSMLDTGGNIPPASESPTTEHLEVPTISATPQREDAATSSPPAAQPSEDTVDSIEARFEFAEE